MKRACGHGSLLACSSFSWFQVDEHVHIIRQSFLTCWWSVMSKVFVAASCHDRAWPTMRQPWYVFFSTPRLPRQPQVRRIFPPKAPEIRDCDDLHSHVKQGAPPIYYQAYVHYDLVKLQKHVAANQNRRKFKNWILMHMLRWFKKKAWLIED